MNKKKNIMIIFVVAIFVLLLLGVTFAYFNYVKVGGVNQLVTGDIYMSYEENSEKYLTLSNALPSSTYDATKYFEFTVQGHNGYSQDIYYDINLVHGDIVDDKVRILDKFLKFTLTKTINGVTEKVIDSKSYSDLTNRRIYVNKIDANTPNNDKVIHTYRLYMWIDNSVIISDTEEDKDYTTSQWNNLFASIKVSVTGDFTEKEVEEELVYTDESCFNAEQVSLYYEPYLAINNYTCSDTSIVIPPYINDEPVRQLGNEDSYFNENLSSVVIPNTVFVIYDYAFTNTSIKKLVIPDSVTTIGTYAFAWHSALEEIVIGSSVVSIGNSAFETDSEYNSTMSLKKIVNKTGRAFKWDKILGGTPVGDNFEFVTGTYSYRDTTTNNLYEILITNN